MVCDLEANMICDYFDRKSTSSELDGKFIPQVSTLPATCCLLSLFLCVALRERENHWIETRKR